MKTGEHNLHYVMRCLYAVVCTSSYFTINIDASGTGPIVIHPRHHGRTIAGFN